MTDLVIRPLTAGEEPLFASLPDPGLVGFAAFGDSYSEMAARGEYRPEWTWFAMRAGTVVARAAWWAGPDDDMPVALDWFDFSDADAAVQLLRTAPLRAEYSLRLPAGWRDSPAVAQAAQARIAAAEAAGLSLLVERYRYRWTPECGLPERPGRLEFRPEPDDAVVLEIFRRVSTRAASTHMPAARSLPPGHQGGPAGWPRGSMPPPGRISTCCAGCPARASGGGWPTPPAATSSASPCPAATTRTP